jgi:hypothetical protein
MALKAIKYKDNKLEILDQLLLPAVSRYVPVLGVKDGWTAINRMQVKVWQNFRKLQGLDFWDLLLIPGKGSTSYSDRWMPIISS